MESPEDSILGLFAWLDQVSAKADQRNLGTTAQEAGGLQRKAGRCHVVGLLRGWCGMRDEWK